MKLVIIKLSAMGDIIHSMVVLEFIKKNIPNIKIDWVVEEAFAPLLQHNKNINNIIKINLKEIKKTKNIIKLFKLIKNLKSLQYDLAIDMQGLIKSAFISRLISNNVYGFDKNSTREGLSSIFYKHSFKIDYNKNVILRGVELVNKSLGINITPKDIYNKHPFLHYTSKDKKNIQKYIKDDLILIIVGASWKSKIYPADNFVKLINLINKEVLLIWGNQEEKHIADTIASNTKFAKVCKKLSIPELISLIHHSSLTIGGDTGPVHIAWALNTPSITIFGPTPSFRNTIATKINKIIDTGKKIDPSKLNKNDFSIKNISANDVYRLIWWFILRLILFLKE